VEEGKQVGRGAQPQLRRGGSVLGPHQYRQALLAEGLERVLVVRTTSPLSRPGTRSSTPPSKSCQTSVSL
jgi:hypothetical protein